MYRGAPFLLWVSKMQTQIALSTMEAEYITLSQSMRDLIPIREVLKEVMTIVFECKNNIAYHSHSKAFADTSVGSMPCQNIPQSTIFEDNDACLKFACMPKWTPPTKHIGVPYHQTGVPRRFFWYPSFECGTKIDEIIVSFVSTSHLLQHCKHGEMETQNVETVTGTKKCRLTC